MPSVEIVDSKRKKAGQVELADEVFGIKPNMDLVQDAVVMQRANARQGTAGTKTRHFVSGGGIKPYKQKGTGRARAGSIRSPLWKGGGTIFGPHPRDYSYSMPKKASKKALQSLLSAKLRDGEIIVMDKLAVSGPKTKEAAALLAGLNISGTTMILTTGEDNTLYMAARNIPGVKVCRLENINVYDLMKYRNLLSDRDTLEKLQEVLK